MWSESHDPSAGRRLGLCMAVLLMVTTAASARGTRKGPPAPETTWKVVETPLAARRDPLLPTPAERLNEQIRIARGTRFGSPASPVSPDSSRGPAPVAPPALAGGSGLPLTSEPFLIGGFLLGLALIATSFWIGQRQHRARAATPAEEARNAPEPPEPVPAVAPQPRSGQGIIRAMLRHRAPRVSVPPVETPDPAPTDHGVTPWWAETPRVNRDLFTPARAVLPPHASPAPPAPPEPQPDRWAEVEAEFDADRAALGAINTRLDLVEGSMLELIRSVERLAVRIESRPERRERPPAPVRPEPTPAPVIEERPALGPWEDPSLALPPQSPRIRPEPFFARIAAERKERRIQEQIVEVPPAPVAPPRPLPTPAEPPRMQARAALPDLSKTRELVLSLARRGWNGERISREAQLPPGDVSLILKTAPSTAAPGIGAADLGAGGR